MFRAEYLELDEFLATESVGNFRSAIESTLSKFLGQVHDSWERVEGSITLVLTGGGAMLPMLSQLADQRWTGRSRRWGLRRAAELPPMIEREFDTAFKREYPKLAVALGGAMPVLDEGRWLDVWEGGEGPPGTLERYPVTGI